jgi:hypothetical protein
MLREEANQVEPTPDEDRDETMQINPLRHGVENVVLQEYEIPPPLQEESEQ